MPGREPPPSPEQEYREAYTSAPLPERVLPQAWCNQRRRTPRRRSVHTTVSYEISSDWSWSGKERLQIHAPKAGKMGQFGRESIAGLGPNSNYVFLTKRSGARHLAAPLLRW